MPTALAVVSVVAKLPFALYVSFTAVDCSVVRVMMDNLLIAHRELKASPLKPKVPNVCMHETSGPIAARVRAERGQAVGNFPMLDNYNALACRSLKVLILEVQYFMVADS